MKVLAISVSGKEFLYNPKTAHKVSNASAKTICDICNQHNYKLSPGKLWFIHDVDQYDSAYIYAQQQRFSIRKGIVTESF